MPKSYFKTQAVYEASRLWFLMYELYYTLERSETKYH